ncbi:MAG TPA: DUF5694 domain-containing protein [Pseudomonadales bacterium]|nr:DUF5694 domain-containing protein [Pseudomonadales bacterium]
MRILALLLTLAAPGTFAEAAADSAATADAQVLMFGVFHFHNPGLDLVKTGVIDVTTAANQAWLEGLAERIAVFAPTVVLVETPPADDDRLNARYRAWRAGATPLGVNEIEQIGFRVARAAGLDGLHGIDEQEIAWEPEAMSASLPTAHPELQAQLDATIAEITETSDRAQRELSLRELLVRANGPEQDRVNRNLYLLTNPAGAGTSFLGADATASWWHRNLRMYANVQRRAQPGERVLVIAGQGHTALLKQFLDSDLSRRAVAIDDFL